MRKMLAYLALSAVLMSFFGGVYGDELNESDSQLVCTPCHEANAALEEEYEIQSEKIYVEPQDISILNNQILAYLNGQWSLVTGLYADGAGLYIVRKGYHPDCPPNFQKPVCINIHPAVYEVYTPKGVFERFLCERHGCDYEYHDYIRTRLPPGYYVIRARK